jgi:hypothetical protein
MTTQHDSHPKQCSTSWRENAYLDMKTTLLY